MNIISEWKLVRKKCSWCKTKIPKDDIVNATSHPAWKTGLLYCKRCRGEGTYNDRCPICNNSHIKETEDKEYTNEEITRMHKNCLLYLLNDYKYQYGFHHKSLVERLKKNKIL